MNDAAEIRARMKAQRMGLDAARQKADAESVYARIRLLPEYRAARCVMAYMACRGELSLEAVIDDVLGRGRVLALPRCDAPGMMSARRVISRRQLVRGAYGLLEPEDCCEILDPQRIDLVLTPGTAFDTEGHRLGQGGGYYDRFLPKTSAAVFGVCHNFALFDSVPSFAHDCAVDAVITPSGVIRCGYNLK